VSGLLVIMLLAAAPSEGLLRQILTETAVRQVEAIDLRWHPEQRDCAGFVRFAYRAAFEALDPKRVGDGMWRDGRGRRVAFADAETLVSSNFSALGRDHRVVARLRSGDLVAFRQQRSADAAPIYHLMMIVRPQDRAHDEIHLIYHPGSRGDAVRIGSLSSLRSDAPRAWQPIPENPFFLGFFRLREWTTDD
jgi:uncharacterized protein YfaT (DUF1175 family)